jgi:hypothetical protein
MTLEIITPTLGKIKKPVKDLIISTLMYDYPLTLIKLTNAIKKKFTVGVTFQGVRRAVNNLVEEKILLKKGKEYEINRDWILEMKEFIDKLHDSYSTPEGNIINIEELGDDIKIYTLRNLLEADKFWNNIIAKWFEEDKNQEKPSTYAQLCGHTWYVFGQMGEETAIVDKSRRFKINAFILCNGDTYLDRWCKKYYSDLGSHFTTNKDKNKGDNAKYFGTYKNYIIQTEYPKWLTEELDSIYVKAKNFDTFNAQRLTKAVLKKTPIKIIVMRNNLLAEQLRKSVLAHFDNHSKQ